MECQSTLNKKRDYKKWYWSYNRAYAVNYKYKLTIEEYEKIISRGCEICGSTDRLVLDHNHEMGTIRGCLCHKCNTAIGLFDDNTEKLSRAINYLRKHSGPKPENIE